MRNDINFALVAMVRTSDVPSSFSTSDSSIKLFSSAEKNETNKQYFFNYGNTNISVINSTMVISYVKILLVRLHILYIFLFLELRRQWQLIWLVFYGKISSCKFVLLVLCIVTSCRWNCYTILWYKTGIRVVSICYSIMQSIHSLRCWLTLFRCGNIAICARFLIWLNMASYVRNSWLLDSIGRTVPVYVQLSRF